MNIPVLILHILTAGTGVAVFAILWRARSQSFARINNAWRFVLAGLALLISARITYTYEILYESARSMDILQATSTFCGFLLLAFGVQRWIAAAHTLSSEVSDISDANSQLQGELLVNSACLSIVPAALYRFRLTVDRRVTDFEFANDGIEKIVGYKRQFLEPNEDPIESLMHPDDLSIYTERDLPLFIDGQLDFLEHRVRTASGDYRWLRRYLRKFGDRNDNSTEWVGCGFDITDLKHAEERLQKFLDTAPDAVLTLDQNGLIIGANLQASKLFQSSAGALTGLKLHGLLPGIELTIEDTTVELTGKRADSSEFPAEIKLSPMDCNDETLYACAIRDLSGRREIEAQLRQAQKMEAVGQLTGGIAHDFNNLLTVVIGNLQMLELDDELSKGGRKLSDAALNAALRGAELTRRLLAFSRQQVLTPKVLQVNELVLGIAPLLERTLGEVVTLKTMLSEDVWAVRVDPSQLENSLVNLAINARDAMPSGGRLTVETSNSRLDEDYAALNSDVVPGDYVLITVGDNGMGIPVDALPFVFDPFFTTKDTGKGSGLGLSMVHGFVKQSAGHIKIYSEIEHGTLVKIYLPRSPETVTEDLDFTGNMKGIPCGDETILIVEDEPQVRELTVKMLSRLGYRVIATQSANEALQFLTEHSNIDLLFTDIVMPGGMTGADLAQEARRRWPDLRVMFTSGYTNATFFDDHLLTARDTILTKPYRREELAHRVREILDDDQ